MKRWAKLQGLKRAGMGLLLLTLLGCNGMLPGEPLQNEPAAALTVPKPPVEPPPAGGSPTFYGAPRCGNANVAVCDSFEPAPGVATAGHAPDPNLWEVEISEISGAGASVQLDGSRAARGGQALHVHAPAQGYQHAVIVHKKLFPVPNNSFYGRAFVYLAGSAPQEHFTLFNASGTFAKAPSPTYVRYGGQFGILEASYVGNDQVQHAGAPVNGGWEDATAMPTQRWVCMEWQYKGDTNEMHFWLDGVEVPRLAVIGQSNECCTGQVWNAPPYDRVALGWEVYASPDPSRSSIESYDLWLDEVALDAQRIGCVR